MADSLTCSGFAPNPAIFGFGLRISFYFIAILAALTPVKSTFSPLHFRNIEQGLPDVQPTREISSVVTVQGVTGLGLLVTAVIQIIWGNQLSLYHAYLVINLLFLMSTSFLYFLFSPNPVVRRRVFYLFFLVLLAIFSLYVGLTARTFGSQPECNNTIKIIWFHPFTASFAWFHGFGITICAIYMTVAFIHGVQLKFFRKRASGSASGKYFRWHGLVVLVINFFLIGAIEATISVNKVAENSWGSFGQTLPLVMFIIPIADVWNDNYPLIKAALLKRRVAQSPSRIPLASYGSHSSHGSRPSRSGYSSVNS